jgi:hypothetical protein
VSLSGSFSVTLMEFAPVPSATHSIIHGNLGGETKFSVSTVPFPENVECPIGVAVGVGGPIVGVEVGTLVAVGTSVGIAVGIRVAVALGCGIAVGSATGVGLVNTGAAVAIGTAVGVGAIVATGTDVDVGGAGVAVGADVGAITGELASSGVNTSSPPPQATMLKLRPNMAVIIRFRSRIFNSRRSIPLNFTRYSLIFANPVRFRCSTHYPTMVLWYRHHHVLKLTLYGLASGTPSIAIVLVVYTCP